MKKENEVLQAAEAGNVTRLESLFEQRQSKVFAGLFKGPNINWRNENGCTALHLAALNGHGEAVIFLLHNDASANTPDNAGSFPLHLAAFNGHASVARILIERGPSKARVNEQNMTGDTALHVAAQYNHHMVMDVLLKHHADIFLRNAKEESALDLAAQYGRFTAVQMLLFKDLNILKQSSLQHTPLHLAARNGHLKVVKLLLDSGMPIDSCCEMGTALHTAALFGKVEVAKFLLRRGINIEIENSNNEKVLDLLCKTPSRVSQQITALIYEHSGLSSEVNTFVSERLRTESLPASKLSSYDYVAPKRGSDITESLPASKLSSYDYVTPKRGSDITKGSYPYVVVEGLGKNANRLSNCTEGFDLASLTGKKEKGEKLDLNLNKEKTRLNQSDLNGDTLQNSDIQGSYVEVDIKRAVSKTTNPDNISVYSVPPNFGNQRLRSDPTSNSNSHRTEMVDLDYNYNQLGSSEQQAMLSDAAHNLLGIKPLSKSVPINMHNFDISDVMKTSCIDSYDNIAIKNIPVDQCLETYDNVNLGPPKLKSNPDVYSLYDNVNLSHGRIQSSYDNVNLKNIPSIVSDVKPHGAKEKSVKQKRTIVRRDIVIDDDPSQLSTSVKADLPSVDNIEKFEPSKSQRSTKVKQARTSVRNVQEGYRMTVVGKQDALDETYEWNKIDKFVSELEIYAEDVSPSEDVNKELKPDSVATWLNSFGLVHYEPMFLSDGFDDIAFLNGIICDEDLIRLGIIDSEHRKKILDASFDLPKSPVIGDHDFPFPKDIHEWLSKLKLLDYTRRFIHYGYDNMERVRVIWELELVSVLEITMVGHCKRMLSSLGKSTYRVKDKIPLNQKIENKDISTKKSDDYIDDSMDVAKQLLETAESLKIERLNRTMSSGNAKCDDEEAEDIDVVDKVFSENSPEMEWVHNSETLLNSAVSYSMQYLGSHPVYDVKGIKSTYDACSKMKVLGKNIHKMPSVTLSISVRGIDYIDSNSKMIISQYSINNISYCAQDPDDLNIFAYITRDEVTRKHYCHVLRVPSVELADEIIVTIGQCFELAYQSYLKTINEMKHRSLSSDQKPQIPARTSSLLRKPPTDRKPPPQPKPFTGEVSL